jgi:hypothetical protein
MRCGYVVLMRWMVIYEYEVPGGALNINSVKLPRPWSPWESSPSGKNPHGRTGNRTWDLMINSQKLWPLYHEAGLIATNGTSQIWHLLSKTYQYWKLKLSDGKKSKNYNKLCSHAQTHFVCPLLHLRVSCSNCYGNWYINMLKKHWITNFSIAMSYNSPTVEQEKMNLLLYFCILCSELTYWVHYKRSLSTIFGAFCHKKWITGLPPYSPIQYSWFRLSTFHRDLKKIW